MKTFLRWLGRTVGGAITIVLVLVLFPYVSRFAASILPDESGAALRASAVLSSRLENSARLETLKVDETGVISYDIQAAFIGTVASIDISYAYSGSFGINMKDVQLRISGSEIVFILPEPVLIQDVLTPDEIYRDDFWYPGFSDEDYEKLLEDERMERRELYLSGENEQILWDATVTAFEETVAIWLTEFDDSLTFSYEKAADAAQPQ